MINLYRIKYKSGKTDFFLATEEDKIEEEKLFNTSTEVNKLLESLKHLENKENESKTQ